MVTKSPHEKLIILIRVFTTKQIVRLNKIKKQNFILINFILSGLVSKSSDEGQEAAAEVAVFLFQPGRPGNVRVHALPLY